MVKFRLKMQIGIHEFVTRKRENAIIQIRFIPDEPIGVPADDDLGFSSFVDRIYSSLQETQTPFVYGILGTWGSGKTSVQRLLAEKFDQALVARSAADGFATGRYLYVPVWLDAWKYENEDNMIFPLLHAFRQKRTELIGGETTAAFLSALRDVVATTTLSLLDLGLRGITKATTGDAMKLKDIKENLDLVNADKDKLETILTTWAESVDGLSEKYRAFIETFANEVKDKFKVSRQTVRFIVFIDDLDRCLPEIAVKVLEGIKNHLSVQDCVYVLGINPAVIHRGIRAKYRDLDISGREYLEKILNYSFEMPVATTGLINAYGTKQLSRLLAGGTQEERKRYEMALQAFGDALESCPFTNPRKIKRILNTYLFYVSFTPGVHDPAIPLDSRFDLQVAVKLIILAEYYPDFFMAASADSGGIDLAVKALAGDQNAPGQFRSKFGFAIETLLGEFSAMPGLLTLPLSTKRPKLDAHIKSVRELARRT